MVVICSYCLFRSPKYSPIDIDSVLTDLIFSIFSQHEFTILGEPPGAPQRFAATTVTTVKQPMLSKENTKTQNLLLIDCQLSPQFQWSYVIMFQVKRSKHIGCRFDRQLQSLPSSKMIKIASSPLNNHYIAHFVRFCKLWVSRALHSHIQPQGLHLANIRGSNRPFYLPFLPFLPCQFSGEEIRNIKKWR